MRWEKQLEELAQADRNFTEKLHHLLITEYTAKSLIPSYNKVITAVFFLNLILLLALKKKSFGD